MTYRMKSLGCDPQRIKGMSEIFCRAIALLCGRRARRMSDYSLVSCGTTLTVAQRAAALIMGLR